MRDARLGNLLGAAAVALGDRLRRAVAGTAGLEGEAAAAVLTIGARPGRSIKHLCRTLGLSHSGAVRLVARLEDRGWIQREARSDGRKVGLQLTGSGRRMHDQLLAARRRLLEAALRPLSAKQRSSLEEALDALLRALPGDRTDAWHICRYCEHRVCRGDACPVGSAGGVTEERP
jgi:DNA-binding MarR family transcriptional regulator